MQAAVNTRDDDTRRELYLTAIGSSIESGGERLDLDLIRKAVTVVMDDLDDIRTALLDGTLPTV